MAILISHRRSWFAAIIAALSVLITSPTVLAQNSVEVVSRGDANAAYAIKMLDLALRKSGESYHINVQEGAYSAARLLVSTREGTIDVIWAAADPETEQDLIPIRIPLYKGLLGYRLLMVHSSDLNIFAGVQRQEDLKAFKFGQGLGWPDTRILKANGLTVVETAKYEGLFHMLDGSRFDAFPRGIHEPWNEIAIRPDLELTVEPHLLLRYQMPFYLYVSPKKPQLAEAIQRGFEIAIEDGSFDEAFFNDPTVNMVMEKSNIGSRVIFSLENPELSSETPLADHRLWYDPSSSGKL